MKKTVLILTATLILSACVHKMDVEQGNIITEDQINRLHTGMSFTQVTNIMGTPALTNTFNDNRVDYIYTFKPGRGEMTEKHVALTFRKGILREIN